MKLKFIFVLLLSFVVISVMAQNDYAVQWKQVGKYQNENLPKSALNTVEIILKKSLTERNIPQAIKAMIYRNNFKNEIDESTRPDLITDLYTLLSDKSTVVEKSLIHSLIAEQFQEYYISNKWTIDQRSPIVNYVPKDIAEWSKNIFQDKILKELEESVSDAKALLQSKPESYVVLIDLGEDSRTMYPTMYDFLMQRALDILSPMDISKDLTKELKERSLSLSDLAKPTKEFIGLNLGETKNSTFIETLKLYQSFLASLQSRKLGKSVILTDLGRIAYIAMKSADFNKKYQLNALLQLEKANEGNSYVVEVINAIADYYASKGEKEKEYEWLKKGISMYPNYEYINELKNKLMGLEEPSANFSGKNAFYPTEKKTITLAYRNLNRATITIYKYTGAKTAMKVKEYAVNLKTKTTYSDEKQDIDLDIDVVGNYYAELNFDKKNEKIDGDETKFKFTVSNLISLNKRVDKTQYSMFVTDRETGKPLSNVAVSTYVGENKQKTLLQTYKTDENGLIQFAIEGKKDFTAYYYKISKDKDNPDVFNPLNTYSYFQDIDTNSKAVKPTENVTLLTDRSIYRPGQTVYFKLIATEGKNGENAVLSNKSYEIKLLDVNRQEVAKKSLKTNEFGSLASEFVLPQATLNGYFYLVAGSSSTYFQVEEYKRPTFQVTFDKVEKTYKFGEQITLKGHAENFSGVKLQNADVNYTVTRQKMNYWRWFNSSDSQSQIDEQTVKTAEDGSFTVSFVPQKEDNDEGSNYFPSAYLFTVKATVTDLNGETQSEEYTIHVADVSMILDIDLDAKYSKEDSTPIHVKATNLDGNEIPTKGTYVIYALDEKDSIGAEMIKGSFESGQQIALEQQLKKLASGKYRIILKANDSNGKEVEGRSDFVLYSLTDKRPPYKTNDWFMVKNAKIAPEKPVEVIVGVSEKDVYVLYELTKGYDVLERRIVKLSDENRLFSLPYKKEYEENTAMTFTLIRNGKMIQHRIGVAKSEENKELKLKFETFRDKLRPGQKEEWKITVKDAKGQPVSSELLASMYDQSLDKIAPMNVWRIMLAQKQNGIFSPLYSLDNSSGLGYFYFNFSSKYWDVKNMHFDAFAIHPQAQPMRYNLSNVRIRGASSLKSALNVGLKSQEDMNDEKERGVGVINSENKAQIRTNFNETAFFYPQLRTNEKGETVISFIVPESNTTWKFRALAYDKDLNNGDLEATVVTRKELMVTPNLPRFVRVGDMASVSAKISNLSENSIDGKVRVEFFNPLTDEVIDMHIANPNASFSLAKDASSSVSWTFVVPVNFDMLGCRIVAESALFSDGEQHIIPVLPDKMLVTESLPIYIRGGQSKQFSFNHLLNNQSTTLTNERLTLEFSTNPAWYAVQALPVLSNPDGENAVSWFASYYVNTLGSFIPKQYPRVASMIEAWKQQGGTKETLFSALQKNEELKNVLLQETPWVLEAKNETEQKQSLSLLFDMNRSQSLTVAAIKKLTDLQTEKGGWSWFKGFYPSRSITQYILYGFSQLVSLNAVEYPTEVKQMQINSLNYLDKEVAEEFANLKKYNKDWANIKTISTSDLEYMYVRSSYRDIPISKEAREAERFYTSVAERYWTNLNLYEQSLLVVLAKRNGNSQLVAKIIPSLREHATVSDEMGMYWANNNSSVFFSRSAVAVHTFLMDAFKTCGSTSEEMDNMKLWLLKQKQTQQWESTHGTLSAIYALLSNGSDWMASKGDVSVHMGNTEINTSDKELGTGYLKQTWEKEAINRDLGKISVQKKDNGPAYGAVYWQYFEKLNKVENQLNKELNVTKMLFKEVSSEKGKVLTPIANQGELSVGDKVVVRLVVRADRDMDFVQIKDMRAACFEPIDQTSGVQWNNRAIYYSTSRDASTNFYFDRLQKGTYTFEYAVYVARSGEYKNGITSIQCLYAPEYVSHTEGIDVKVMQK